MVAAIIDGANALTAVRDVSKTDGTLCHAPRERRGAANRLDFLRLCDAYAFRRRMSLTPV